MHDGIDHGMGDTHGHEGAHCHDHGCASCAQCDSKDELLALLKYTYEHNRHHNAELLDMQKKLRALGLDAAAEQLGKSIDDYDKGDVRLAAILNSLKG